MIYFMIVHGNSCANLAPSLCFAGFPCVTPHNELVKSYKSVGCVPPRLKFLFRTFDRLSHTKCTSIALMVIIYILNRNSTAKWLTGPVGNVSWTRLNKCACAGCSRLVTWVVLPGSSLWQLEWVFSTPASNSCNETTYIPNRWLKFIGLPRATWNDGPKSATSNKWLANSEERANIKSSFEIEYLSHLYRWDLNLAPVSWPTTRVD